MPSQLLAEEQRNKGYEALTSSIQMAQQAQHIGVNTAEKLGQQREQLGRVQDDLGEISDRTERTARVLKRMRSWFAMLCSNCAAEEKEEGHLISEKRRHMENEFEQQQQNRRRKAAEERSMEIRKNEEAMMKDRKEVEMKYEEMKKKDPLIAAKWYAINIQRLEENEQLDELQGMMKNVRLLAEDIGDELDLQDNIIDNLHHQMDNNSEQMAKQSRAIQKMIK